MGRKKRNRLYVAPFCYYCEKECPDDKVLIQHQKARHFKCSECNKKLDTATGLVVHMIQVHKINLAKVPNAMEARKNPELQIHGMDGVPQELIDARRQAQADKKGIKVLKSSHTVSAGHFSMMPPQFQPQFLSQPTPVPFSAPPPMAFNMMGGPTIMTMNHQPAATPSHYQGDAALPQQILHAVETIKLAPSPPAGDLIYGVENISPDERRFIDMQRMNGIRAT
eukprot:GHVH01000881.1.p1 GENE.GHVH01000881.1~~GHVH01000881.1.p1  ORF type:complete len:244 (+),score=37.55 GHVH01000881.1:63-734(+)